MSVDAVAVSRRARLVNLPYQWRALWIVVLGTFMVVLDTTIVSIGLSSIGTDFHTDRNIEWVVTSYIVALGVAQLISGWLGDRVGRVRLYLAALGVFTIGSLACSVAPGFGVLIAARALQGLGGGIVMPIAMAIIYDLFEPTERGRAIGYFSIALMAAPAIGPVVGGALVSSVGWRWMFLINVPIGLVVVPVTARLLRETRTVDRRRFDGFSFGLMSVGLICLLIGLQQGGSWGWTAHSVLGLLAGGALLLGISIVSSLRSESPVVEVRIFANPVFAVSMVVMALSVLASYTRVVYIPLELEGLRGIEASRVGWLMMPSAVGMAITLPVGGKLVDKLGARLPVAVGLTIVTVAYWQLSHLTVTTSLWTISVWIFLSGLGSGIGMTAPNVIAMNAVRATQVGQASALTQVGRQVMLALGLAVMASVFVGRLPASGDTSAGATARAMHAYNTMFEIAFWFLVSAIVLAQLLPNRAKNREMLARLGAERDAMRADGHLVGSGAVMDI